MKYLLLARLMVEVPPPDDYSANVRAARAYLDAARAEDWLDCIYVYAGGRKSVLIADAASHEEVLDWLRAHPAYPNWDFEVHPLVGIDHYFDTLMAGMGQG